MTNGEKLLSQLRPWPIRYHTHSPTMNPTQGEYHVQRRPMLWWTL